MANVPSLLFWTVALSKVENDREMAVDDLGCNEEDEENQPFIDEDYNTDVEDDNVNDD